MEHAARVTANATIILAIATIVLVVVTTGYVVLTSRISRSAAESAESAERAAKTAERALLADFMPLLITKWLTGRNFRVVNVGRSTALNGLARYNGADYALAAIHAGDEEREPRTIERPPAPDGVRGAAGTVILEYTDAIGNRYQTKCELTYLPAQRADYETFMWDGDDWRSLRTQTSTPNAS